MRSSTAPARRAGLAHATCHQLRHTCLTQLRKAGMSLEAVQAQAGHASIESTRIYLHLGDDWLASQYRRAAEAIDAQALATPALERPVTGPALLPGWAQLEQAIPQITGPMRRYLEQVACVLRPGSVSGADLALRSFAAFLAEASSPVSSLTQVTRRHVEAFKPWLAARPGQNKPRLTTATIAHRLGTLRMFFVRIEEWGWDEAPPRVPMFPGDLPRQDHPLPKALDDATAAKLLRAAQADRRMLVRVTVEMLLRTGLRVSEYTGLQADAVVLIGAGPWLHVPVGKLHEDRYLPLHPQLVTLIDAYRASPRPRGPSAAAAPRKRPPARPAHRHPDDQPGRRRRGPAAHPPPPAPAHPGHPGHQPRDEPGSDRRPARPPQPGHDPAVCEDRQPHRRRRVLRRQSRKSKPSTASPPSSPPTPPDRR